MKQVSIHPTRTRLRSFNSFEDETKKRESRIRICGFITFNSFEDETKNKDILVCMTHELSIPLRMKQCQKHQYPFLCTYLSIPLRMKQLLEIVLEYLSLTFNSFEDETYFWIYVLIVELLSFQFL